MRLAHRVEIFASSPLNRGVYSLLIRPVASASRKPSTGFAREEGRARGPDQHPADRTGGPETPDQTNRSVKENPSRQSEGARISPPRHGNAPLEWHEGAAMALSVPHTRGAEALKRFLEAARALGLP